MGGFAPLSVGLVLPCLMKITGLGRADFLPDLTPPICQITELLQSSRSREGGTGARLQLQLQAQSWAGMFATHSSFFSPENRQINRFMWIFPLFNRKVQELKDKV